MQRWRLSAQRGEGPGLARERVANAITGLFSDNRNIASERNADSMAGVRFNESANQPTPTATRPGHADDAAGER